MFSSLAFAQENTTCARALFTCAEALSLAKVSVPADGKTYFFDDANDCPAPGDGCKRTAYLIAGGKIILSKENEGFNCAWVASAACQLFSSLYPTVISPKKVKYGYTLGVYVEKSIEDGASLRQ